jgi:hypothetical protein
MLPLVLLMVLGRRSRLWHFRHIRRLVWTVLAIVAGLMLVIDLYATTGWLQDEGRFWLSGWISYRMRGRVR